MIGDLAAVRASSYESSSFGFVCLDNSFDGKALIGSSNSYKNSWYPRLVKLSLAFPPYIKWQNSILPEISPYITTTKKPSKDGSSAIGSALGTDYMLETDKSGWEPPIMLVYASQSYERMDEDIGAIEQSIGNWIWITLIVGVFCAILLGLSISSRIISVKRGIGNLALDLTKPVPHVSGELGDIADAANKLAIDLMKSKSRSERVLDSVNTGIMVVGSDMKIIQANPSSLKIAKKTKQEIIGSDIGAIGEPGEIAKSEVEKAIKSGSVWSSGSVKVRGSNETRYVNMRVVPVQMAQENEAILAIQDVTESVVNTLETERDASLARLGLFTMGIAHEVRNPLTSIKGFVQLLERKLKDRDESRYLSPVMKEVERLEMLITDLLESSRPGPIKRKEVDLSKLVNDVLAGQANKLTEAGVRISKECRPGVIANVDEKRFHQVILNLILNAKDAMPEGGTLSLKTGESGEWFHIEVRDTGMGISEQDAANIFAPFFTTKASGTGLGLSICDQIVKSHGGSISFTSDENGTTFVVKIPKIIKMED